MRVLIVHPGIYVYGGAELVIIKLANFLTKQGIENALLTTAILPEVREQLDGTEIILRGTRFPIKVSSINELISLYGEVSKQIGRFDVINVHNYPAELSVLSRRKPVVWMCNEPLPYLLTKLENVNYLAKLKNKLVLDIDRFVVRNFVNYGVVADDFNAARYKDIYGVNPLIVNYGIDWDFFSNPGKVTAYDKMDRRPFVVLHVGMLTQFKNQLASVKALESLKSTIPNIKLILAGWSQGEYADKVKGYVKNNNLEDKVSFTGHISRNQLRDLYYSCDILLHPVKAQGGWLSPFEALSAGKPIIVSKEMTAADLIQRTKVGVVVDNYASAILDVYSHPERYHEMAEYGKKWVRDNLQWDNFCQKMVGIFYHSLEKSTNT